MNITFGVEKNISDSDANPFRYCGEYFDAETGTIYLRARYYDPAIGRFISRDSYAGRKSDPLSLNLYTYCINNPIRYADPSGHFKIPKWVKSVGNWFEERYDDWKTGAEEISNTVKTSFKKNKDKIEKGATKIVTFVAGKFNSLVKTTNKFVNPTTKIFDSKDKAGVLRVAHSANVINIGSGKEDDLYGVESKKSDEYIEHCQYAYDNLTCYGDYEYIAENGYNWDQLDSETQKSIVDSMLEWDREYYYNTATYIAAENIDDATKIIWRSAGLFS